MIKKCAYECLWLMSVLFSAACSDGDQAIDDRRYDDQSTDDSQDEGLSAEECSQVKSAMESCYDGYCAGVGASSSFCGCWNQGMDLAFSCQCVALDFQAVCTYFGNLDLDANDINCPAAQEAVGNICSAP